MQSKSYLTAIGRTTLPKPTRWLIQQGLIKGKVMDYGCGKCFSVNPSAWHNYDPYHCDTTYLQWSGYYDTVICNYVLCVLPPDERMAVLKNVQRLLNKSGTGYVSVRNDKPRYGWGVSKRGTYQGRVRDLPMPLLYKCHGFRVYRLTRDMKLV